jgi:hypothetical protein
LRVTECGWLQCAGTDTLQLLCPAYCNHLPIPSPPLHPSHPKPFADIPNQGTTPHHHFSICHRPSTLVLDSPIPRLFSGAAGPPSSFEPPPRDTLHLFLWLTRRLSSVTCTPSNAHCSGTLILVPVWLRRSPTRASSTTSSSTLHSAVPKRLESMLLSICY